MCSIIISVSLIPIRLTSLTGRNVCVVANPKGEQVASANSQNRFRAPNFPSLVSKNGLQRVASIFRQRPPGVKNRGDSIAQIAWPVNQKMAIVRKDFFGLVWLVWLTASSPSCYNKLTGSGSGFKKKSAWVFYTPVSLFPQSSTSLFLTTSITRFPPSVNPYYKQ